jgi:hypothetical protein
MSSTARSRRNPPGIDQQRGGHGAHPGMIVQIGSQLRAHSGAIHRNSRALRKWCRGRVGILAPECVAASSITQPLNKASTAKEAGPLAGTPPSSRRLTFRSATSLHSQEARR